MAESQRHCGLAGARAAYDLRRVAAIADALKALADLLTFLHVLPVLAQRRMMELLQCHPISGGDVFDPKILATMLSSRLGIS